MEMERLTIRLTATDRALLDRLRGRRSRGAYLRNLLRAAAGGNARAESQSLARQRAEEADRMIAEARRLTAEP